MSKPSHIKVLRSSYTLIWYDPLNLAHHKLTNETGGQHRNVTAGHHIYNTTTVREKKRIKQVSKQILAGYFTSTLTLN
jgi:hypothetical protein